MALLRRVLYLNAAISGISSMVLVAVPRLLLSTALGQPEYPDYAFFRLLGVAGIVLAMLMVLVGHRVEELWWWCWTFVALEFGGAAVATLHLAFGLPPQAAGWPWWAMAGISWLFAGGFLWGIARAGTEAPPP